MTFLLWAVVVSGATLVGAVGLALVFSANAFAGVALPLAVAGTALLVVAGVRDRRNRGMLRLRHCLECGASVTARAAVCPRCSSVRLERIAGDGNGGRAGRRASAAREMPVSAFSPDRSGVIGWVDSAPPGADGWAVGEGAATKRLRVWGIALWAVAGACLAFGLFGILSPS
ncbi:MAG: hypothetical protein HY332_14740 [Chloroflexi bacterium]|nr:hypothetical protein [Chloroflexota bacterium]